jgi:hypothetical protein
MRPAQRLGFSVRLVGVMVTVVGLFVFAVGSEVRVGGDVLIYSANPISQFYWPPYRAVGMIIIGAGLAVFSWGVGYARGLRRAAADLIP